jgi:hypothetical protein
MESKQQKPKRKILNTVIASILISTAVLWVAGAIGTEATDNTSFFNNAAYTDQSGILQKTGYDLMHPLDFIKILQNNPIEPDVSVPSAYTEVIDQAALDHATGKDGTPIDYSSHIDPIITASETMFQATSNGTTVSDSQLSSLLESAVKPFKESTFTADVSLLFPIKNPGSQIITVAKLAHTDKGWNIDGVIGPEVLIDWETRLTIPDKGSEIILPVNAKVYKITSKSSNGKTYLIHEVLVRFTGSDGTNYELSIYKDENDWSNPSFPRDYSVPTDDSMLPAGSTLTSVADAPEIDYDTYVSFSSAAGIKGEFLPAGTPILKTVNNNTKIGFSLRCDKKGSLPDFNFISSEGKLVYLP